MPAEDSIRNDSTSIQRTSLSSRMFSVSQLSSCVLSLDSPLPSCCKCNVVIPDGHNFVDMLDGRYQCLNCSKHIVGFYQGKEHAPHAENMFGQVIMVQCDQAGRIPICDKCTRPVPNDEEAFQHETRFYHLDCARCNRCRKKLFQVPCRKLGSALGKILGSFVIVTERFLGFSLSHMFISLTLRSERIQLLSFIQWKEQSVH